MDSYKTKYYESYAKNHVDISATDLKNRVDTRRRYLTHAYSGFFPKNKAGKIVDLGCGYGSMLYALKKLGYKNISGVDASHDQVKFAQSLDLDVVEGDAFEYLEKIPDDSIDMVITYDFIEHIGKDDLFRLTAIIRRKISRDGVWISHQPNAWSPFFSSVLYGDITHEFAYTPDSITRIMAYYDYKKCTFYEEKIAVHGLKSFVRYVLWKFIRIFFKAVDIVEIGLVRNIYTRNFLFVISFDK
jgi:SAM-dependent methyltransferase